MRSTFVPHEANQYRPYLIRRYCLLVVAILATVLQLGYNYTQTGRVLGQTSTTNTNELLMDTNVERTKSHLPALRMSAQLSRAAELKAQDMYAKQYWAHTSPDGTQPWHWFQTVGYGYTAAGENLAKNFSNSQATVTAWMNSPAHRDNILSDQYTEVGFAVAQGTLHNTPTTIVVAMYGAPATLAIAGSTDAPAAATQSASPTQTPIARLGVALQSLTPAAIASLILLLITLIIALAAHAYRSYLPKPLRHTWYRHHGIIKANSIAILMLLTVWLYSNGQI